MTWVRLDDNFHWHPKIAGLSHVAYRLYEGALCYANRYQTGGEITLAVADQLSIGRSAPRRELEEGGLWEVIGHARWIIHDYFLYQPDPQKSRAGQAGGQASAQARAQAEGKQPPKQMLKQVLKQNSSPVPVPIPVAEEGVENPPVIPPRGFGIPKTNLHVSDLHDVGSILGSLQLQAKPRKETA